jgi:hypothetical protein
MKAGAWGHAAGSSMLLSPNAPKHLQILAAITAGINTASPKGRLAPTDPANHIT